MEGGTDRDQGCNGEEVVDQENDPLLRYGMKGKAPKGSEQGK